MPHSEGRFEHLDGRPGHDGDIESKSASAVVRIEPRHRSPPNESLLAFVDRFETGAESVARSGLDLAKDDLVAPHHDQIELAASHLPVLVEHNVASCLVVTGSPSFTPPPERHSGLINRSSCHGRDSKDGV